MFQFIHDLPRFCACFFLTVELPMSKFFFHHLYNYKNPVLMFFCLENRASPIAVFDDFCVHQLFMIQLGIFCRYYKLCIYLPGMVLRMFFYFLFLRKFLSFCHLQLFQHLIVDGFRRNSSLCISQHHRFPPNRV